MSRVNTERQDAPGPKTLPTAPYLPTQSPAVIYMNKAGVPCDPATGKPITEFVDGAPVDPATGIPMRNPLSPAVAPGAPGAGDQPSWTEQLQMPGQPGSAPELTSPVPSPLTVALPSQAAGTPGAQIAPAASAVVAPVAPSAIVAPAITQPPVLPAIPATPSAGTRTCVTEGCKSKVKDHGMCARCLKDTIEYMKSDPNVTWEFLEANGLARPVSGSTSGGKFRAGLMSKLEALHGAAGKAS